MKKVKLLPIRKFDEMMIKASEIAYFISEDKSDKTVKYIRDKIYLDLVKKAFLN